MTTMPPEPPDPTGGGTPPGYGAPPPPPPGYGAPPPPGYGAPPPAGYGSPMGGAWAGPPLASWGERALAYLIDGVAPFIVAFFVAAAISSTLGILLYLASLVWVIYNAYLGGATGQSIGKKQIGLRLLREQDGQVIGGGMGVLRWLLHIVDTPCYLGYLWPLWDAKKQTFADKILKTVVVKG